MQTLRTLAAAAILGAVVGATAAPLTLTGLPDLVGGTPAVTRVFRADLASVGIGSFQSITIRDNSSGLGGSPGQFSGFDLDAIVISDQLCATAACVTGLTGFAVFDFSPAGTLFTPGVQRAPADAKLFGTDASGTRVDDLMATLASFDANGTTDATAFGFLSMGDNGILSFNLTSALNTAGLYLYLGEVGDNGEALAGSIEIDRDPVNVPEPSTLALAVLALGALRAGHRRR
jgi:hypothetical protein